MRLAERFNRALFHRVVKQILRTPPIGPGDIPFIALTMVHHRDVLPYLLAVKTFARHARPSRIVMVADPSIDAIDRATLKSHLPHLELLEAAAFRQPGLPVGGTWERLAAIAALCDEATVVQLDADTMTLGEPAEVLTAVRQGRSFVIRSEAGVEMQSLDEAAVNGRRMLASSNHIQTSAEARLTDLPDWSRFRYVRGCSGFTGFARQAMTAALLVEVSTAMRVIHGSRWDEWGTEQVTSNLLAASAPNAVLLTHPQYCNADGLTDATVVAHFIGYARFVNRRYEQLAATAIAALAKPAPVPA